MDNPIIRKNPITHDWVIFAPHRASRPKDFKSTEEDRIALLYNRPKHKADCPFCRGNEHLTATEIWRLPESEEWQVRVIENKYSSVNRNLELKKYGSGLRREISGFGIHDVIIEHPHHNMTLALMSLSDIEMILHAWLRRYQEVKAHPLVRHVVIFKNQGLRAGGSLEHPHSQIYGLPVVPFEVEVRLREMARYYDINDRCLICDLIADELSEGQRVIAQNESFVALMPYADLSPYHFWILPKRHHPCFDSLNEQEIPLLAKLIRHVFGQMFQALKNPDFNLVIQSLSHYEKEFESFHWYISVIPQVKHKGGLEYAGGLYVNPVLPEVAAKEFRDVEESSGLS